jgi:cytochrome P450
MATLQGPDAPFWLRAPKLILRPLDYVEDYRQQYGDVFRVGKAEPPMVYIADPEVIRGIFQADPSQFEIPSQGVGGILSALLGEHSMLLLDGERHRRHRRLLMPPFHGERMRAYGQLICATAEQVIGEWQIDRPFKVRQPMQEITLRVILKAVFGLKDGPRYDELRQLLSTMLENLGTPLSGFFIFFDALQKDWGPWSPWGRFVRMKAKVDQLIYGEIQDRRDRNDFSGDDILTLMMTARDDQGHPLSDEELHDELVTLLIAGHETTASALSWALYWIHALPDVEDKLRYELDSLGDKPEPLEIANLPYLNAICQETLRIYPVAPTTGIRILREPMTINDYDFPKGTVLFPSIYLVHHTEALYPEPKSFKPERFLDRQFSPYEFLPFGGGHRSCIGMAFAMMEMKLVLATVLQRWQLEVVSQKLIKPVRRGLTVAPPSGLKLKVIEDRCHF